ncbi:MAG TPA: zf-HC2 domain-containing protein [Candidatus Tectomicrobia bacterium]|nr:zf-HC2 domain-containing protein [Candidatus Tectomicrobia bacterium]
MTCDEARERFEDLLHDRLSAAESQSLRQHLSECPRCLEELDTAGLIAALIRHRASYHRAPDHLRESILQEVRRERTILERLRAVLQAVWTTPSVLCATTAILVLAITLPLYHYWAVSPPDPAARVVGEATRDYRRLLLNYPPHGTNPAEPTQIEQWFQQTLPFSPSIPFWGNQDIRLLRGYPTFIMERRAACLIFKMGEAISTLYIFPGADIPIPPHNRRRIDGYAPYQATAQDQRVLLWRQGELAFLIVSPLTNAEIDQLFLRIRKP